MSKTIPVSDKIFSKINGQISEQEINEFNDFIGKSFFFRTVTYHMTGRIKKIIGNLFVLEDAAWIADSGRFMQAIKNGILSEVEPVGDAFINISAIVDMFPWKNPLPITQK